MFSRRKGFAIILVAALAGLLFLLGASLVAISQLQRAAANYDQRTRLAREHARAALEIAIAELQKAAGPDQAVTFLADVQRNAVAEDFRSPSAPADSGAYQPFWMGAENAATGSLVKWFVTQALSGTNLPSPYVDEVDYITLLGANTVSAPGSVDPLLLQVRVPKETISVADLQGFSDGRAIGNYAYWVGDLGAKASYALYDKTDITRHGSYAGDDNDRRNRLRQLRANHPGFLTVDQNVGGTGAPDVSNPARIDRYINDFQFRDRYGGLSSDPNRNHRFLIGLEEEHPNQSPPPREVSLYFHDYTPLSKGLLTNSAAAGFKVDLSKRSAPDVEFEAKYLPYVKLAATGTPVIGDYDDTEFSIAPASDDSPAVMPVLTQFNLNYSAYLVRVDDSTGNLFLSFNSAFELWNPFASKLGAESLRFEMKNLPPLKFWWPGETDTFWEGSLASVELPIFRTPPSVNGESFWRPGQIVVFSGPSETDVPSGSPYLLSFGHDLVSSSSDRVEISLGAVSGGNFAFDADYTEAEMEVDFGFHDMGDPEYLANIEVEVYLDASNQLLATYTIVLPDPPPPEPKHTLPRALTANVFEKGRPWFGFSWKLGDGVMPLSAIYQPFNTSLSVDALSGFVPLSRDPANTDPVFEAGDSVLMGYNSTDFTVLDTAYDYPVLQLPKQELVTVSQLSNGYGSAPDLVPIGAPGSLRNYLFDETFFSTVPQSGDEWSVGDPLPNSGYTASAQTASALRQIEDFTDPSTFAASHLYVHGMFNVHSTSIEAWAAMLRASPASGSPYWKSRLEEQEDVAAEAAKTEPDGVYGDGDNELDAELYLFFNYPQSAEDVYVFDPVVETDLQKKRESMRNGMFALTEAQVKQLATQIVKNIRQRVQGVAPYDLEPNGPFTSMEDFVDSGVLENAITGLADPYLNPAWAELGSARQFSQITLLNMLAPYLSVRSDTFLVRAYGDAVNPADPNEIWARAYCEAIVQRTHEMHADSSLGRKMQVVAFRWLAPSEI